MSPLLHINSHKQNKQMKNLLIILVIILNTAKGISQNTNSISSIGETTYNFNKVDNYIMTLQLKEVKSDGYSHMEDMSLEKVIENYKDRLSGQNIDFNSFTENKFMYMYSASYETNKTVYYTYKTSSESDFTKVINIKMLGLTTSNVEINLEKLSSEKMADLSIKAIENAREKAKKIAKKLNKKIGEILTIKNETYNTVSLNYYGNDIKSYSVVVNFELLDI